MPDDPSSATQDPSAPGQSAAATPFETALLVLMLVLLFGLLIYTLLKFWPGGSDNVVFFGRTVAIGTEMRWFVLVLASGALGSYVHVARSASDYIGEQKLTRNWLYWYLLRLPLGAGVALVFYVLFRGGLLTGIEVPINGAQPFGVVGLAALVGMFAREAVKKFKSVFTALLEKSGDENLSGGLDGSKPILTGVMPSPLKAVGATEAWITLDGQHFRNDSVVLVGDETRQAEFKSPTQLRVCLATADLAQEGEIAIAVRNPGVKDGTSTVVKLQTRKPE